MPRLLLVSCTGLSMKLLSPELAFCILGVWTIRGDAEGIDCLILKTRGWIDSLHFVFHLATSRTAWLELYLHYVPVFPAPVIDLAVEETRTIEIP